MSLNQLTIDRSVRGMSPTDALGYQPINNAVQALAARDAALADALNAVIAQLNSTYSLLPLSVPRLNISGSATMSILNYRVPNGYKVNVVNASVASLPAGQVTLNVIYSKATFGQDGAGQSGLVLVTTTTEMFTQTSDYYGPGEIILQIANANASPVETSISVLLGLKLTN
jgi:hypothetical protein